MHTFQLRVTRARAGCELAAAAAVAGSTRTDSIYSTSQRLSVYCQPSGSGHKQSETTPAVLGGATWPSYTHRPRHRGAVISRRDAGPAGLAGVLPAMGSEQERNHRHRQLWDWDTLSSAVTRRGNGNGGGRGTGWEWRRGAPHRCQTNSTSSPPSFLSRRDATLPTE